jgi:4-hydroxy-4-methyl-2-oxoglutarate aldolase
VGIIVHEPPDERIPDEIVEGFRHITVGDIGHIQTFGFMDTAIRPVWRDIRLVGRAMTVRMPGLDIGANRLAIRTAQPGDVIVVDRAGETEFACWGGVAGLLAKLQGAAGLIVDGAVTDSMEFTDLKWPVYSRTLSGLVGRTLNEYAEINTTVNCGGVPVSPGDLIVADDDGIVVIRPWEAADLLKACQDRFGATPNLREWIRDGKPLDDYPAARQFFARD